MGLQLVPTSFQPVLIDREERPLGLSFLNLSPDRRKKRFFGPN